MLSLTSLIENVVNFKAFEEKITERVKNIGSNSIKIALEELDEQILKEREKSIIKIAYYSAYFNNSKKSKSLNYYMKEIDKSSIETKKRDDNKLKHAREMFNKINKTSTRFDK